MVVTVSRGRVVWEGGQLHVSPGTGRFVDLPCGGPLFQGLEDQEAGRVAAEFPHGPTPVQREPADEPAGGGGGREEL